MRSIRTLILPVMLALSVPLSAQNAVTAEPPEASAEQSTLSTATRGLRWKWQGGQQFRLNMYSTYDIDFPTYDIATREYNLVGCVVESVSETGDATIRATYGTVWGDVTHGGDLKARFGDVDRAYISKGWDQHDIFFRTLQGQSFSLVVRPDGVVTSVSGVRTVHDKIMAAYKDQSTPIDRMISPGARLTDEAYKLAFEQIFRLPVAADAQPGQHTEPPADWIGAPPNLRAAAADLVVQAGEPGEVMIRGIVEFDRPDEPTNVKERYLGGGIDDALLWDSSSSRGVARVVSNTAKTERTSADGDTTKSRRVDYISVTRVEFDFTRWLPEEVK